MVVPVVKMPFRILYAWLDGRDQVVLKGKDIDLRMSIKGRTFIAADGHENFPDGEIFTGPVEDSVNGFMVPATAGALNLPGVPADYQVEIKVEEGVLLDNGKTDIEKIRPILFEPDTQRYFAVGGFLGRAFAIGEMIDSPMRG